MARTIRTLVVLDSGVDRTVVESSLPTRTDIQVVGLVTGLDEAWSALQDTPTDLVLLATTGHSERALVFIEGSVKQQPDRPIVVLAYGSPNGFVRRIFEVGADDIATLPAEPDEVGFVIQKVVARRQGTATATGVALAPMICVLGPKGGTGKTLTTGNLAVGLAEAGVRVLALDIDLQFGDLGLSLGLSPEKTLADLARSGGSLDAEKLDGYLVTHASGAHILMAPTRPDHASVVTVEFLRDVYEAARQSHDFVIVDTPPGFTPEVIASIDSSTHVLMVGMLDALSLKNTKLGLETLELMGYDPTRIRVILNRADSRVGITKDDVSAILGREPEIMVPSDRDIPRSINEGMPIIATKRRSEAAKAFRQLSELYLERKPTPSRSMLSRLMGRKA